MLFRSIFVFCLICLSFVLSITCWFLLLMVGVGLTFKISRVLKSSMFLNIGSWFNTHVSFETSLLNMTWSETDFSSYNMVVPISIIFFFAPKWENLYLVLDLLQLRLPRSVARRRVQYYPSNFTQPHPSTTTPMVIQFTQKPVRKNLSLYPQRCNSPKQPIPDWTTSQLVVPCFAQQFYQFHIYTNPIPSLV